MQAELNIGLLGHVDHGKTSVTKALTGTWTDIHSMEIKRGISIKLGYADSVFKKCKKCSGAEAFTRTDKCKCGNGEFEYTRKVAFVDAPGHETLMATVIAASSIIDGAMLIIAANEPCPQPQTKEHKMLLETLGIKNLVVVQNKIDLVTPEKAQENYNQIKEFLADSLYKDSPIIPISANYDANIDALIEAIEKYLPTPKREEGKDPLMYIARSFDVNKPGAEIEKLVGGVLGGSLIQGNLKVGDEIEIRPGISKSEKSPPMPITSKIIGLHEGKESYQEVSPGGLIGLSTLLDPSITKADGLVGNVIGLPGKLPPVLSEADFEYSLLDRVDFENPGIHQNEILVINIGTTTTLGVVDKIKKSKMHIRLRHPICANPGTTLALSRKVGQRWRLCGKGKLL